MAKSSEEDETQADLNLPALVKTYERDFYWSALFAPDDRRAGLLALYAYHVELARIPSLVSDPMVGQVRLKWWRDAIVFAEPERKTGHPIADAFAQTVVMCGLSKDRLASMVDARLADVYREAPADLPALKIYYDETWGAMFEAAVTILDGRAKDVQLLTAPASLAFGLARSLQTLAQDWAEGRSMLPFSFFADRGVTEESFLDGRRTPQTEAALTALRAQAEAALQDFRKVAAGGGLSRSLLPAFLPLAQVPQILSQNARGDFNPLRDPLKLNPLGRFWRIWKAARRGSI